MHLTITTLADLDAELELHAYCKACQRMEKLDKATLLTAAVVDSANLEHAYGNPICHVLCNRSYGNNDLSVWPDLRRSDNHTAVARNERIAEPDALMCIEKHSRSNGLLAPGWTESELQRERLITQCNHLLPIRIPPILINEDIPRGPRSIQHFGPGGVVVDLYSFFFVIELVMTQCLVECLGQVVR